MHWTNDYIGLPFKPHGRLRSEGLDCWGLYRLVLLERHGLSLPLWDTVSPDDHAVVGALLEREAATPEWRQVHPAEADDGDCILMRGYVNGHVGPLHVGCFVQPMRCLHVEIATASVCVSWQHVNHRLLGIYRHRGMP